MKNKAGAPVLVPIALGLLAHWGGSWVVGHDRVNYALSGSGFRCISDMSEVAFALGTVGTVLATLAFAVPAIIASVRGVVSAGRSMALNLLAIPIFFCGLSSPEFIFAVLVLLMTMAWIVALLWALTQPARNAQLGGAET